jgi:hypothetical protein
MSDALETIEVLLPSESRVGMIQTELLWAKQEGEDLYRIYSVPFLAPDIHLGDVVRCVPQPGSVPRVQDVVERSGARTLRLYFSESAADDEIRHVVMILRQLDAVIEQKNRRFWAVGLRTREEFEVILPHLEEFMQSGILHFEA